MGEIIKKDLGLDAGRQQLRLKCCQFTLAAVAKMTENSSWGWERLYGG